MSALDRFFTTEDQVTFHQWEDYLENCPMTTDKKKKELKRFNDWKKDAFQRSQIQDVLIKSSSNPKDL